MATAGDVLGWVASRISGGDALRPAVLEYAAIEASGLFDSDYYQRTHPSGPQPGDPLLSYLREPVATGSRPHPLFDPQTYLDLHPDVAAAGIHPLVHFVRKGVAERRDPDPCFSMAAYLADHPELSATDVQPLRHWAGRALDPQGLLPPRLYRPAPLLLDMSQQTAALTFLSQWDPCDSAQSVPERDLEFMNAAAKSGLPVRLLLHRTRLHPRGLARVRRYLVGGGVEVHAVTEDGLPCHAADTLIACAPADAARAAASDARRGGNNILLADSLAHAHEAPPGWSVVPRDAVWNWSVLRDQLAAAEARYRASWSLHGQSLGYRVLKAPEFDKTRICLFSHFDVDRKLDPHVRAYLKALVDAGVAPWLITSCDGLELESLEAAKRLCAAVIARENRGYDFAGWAMAVEIWPQLFDVDELIFANDSVYGPMVPLDRVFGRMESVPCDVWGMTTSREITPHLQSYFLVFRKSALAHQGVRRFWREVRPLPSKERVIVRYELGLASAIQDAGLRAAAYVPALDASASNPMSKHWRELIVDHAFPFVKVSVLRDNSAGEDIAGWDRVVARGGYAACLIREHLERVRPVAAALSQPR